MTWKNLWEIWRRWRIGHRPVSAGAGPLRPLHLPPLLEDRLRGIARPGRYCQTVEAHWPDLIRGEAPSVEAARFHEHLRGCGRCRRLTEALGDALGAPNLPLPEGLALRLRAVARNRAPKLPEWLVDVRYAVAASYVLASCLVFLLGNDPYAHAAARADSLRQPVLAAVDRAESESEEKLRSLASEARSSLTLQRERLTRMRGELGAEWSGIRTRVAEGYSAVHETLLLGIEQMSPETEPSSKS